MKRKPKSPNGPAGLRRRAEARLRERARRQKSAPGTRRLVHELQVHQVELEMQNAELQEARDRMEVILEKYTDLYDFAPAGYFSVDERGRILELNLTGAGLLGLERTRLIKRPLQQFVMPESRPGFLGLLRQVFAGAGKQVCEVILQKEGCAAFWAEVQAVWAATAPGAARWCRVTVSDISARKQAEEAQRRSEALTVANRELGREIVRRVATEKILRQNEQHKARMLAESRHLRDQLRHLSRRILHAQEEERKRISRQLHDEVTQTLVGINVHLEILAREAALNPQGIEPRVVETQRLVENAVEIVHRFARELRPTVLDDAGLIAALHAFMTEFRQTTGIRIHFSTFGGVEQLNGDQRTVLYRVILSALANVAQHARASQVKVIIRKPADVVHLEISDDGQSFDVKHVLDPRRNRRLGVLGMRERVEMIGGVFSIESTPGRGTTIRAEIPVRNKPARTRR